MQKDESLSNFSSPEGTCPPLVYGQYVYGQNCTGGSSQVWWNLYNEILTRYIEEFCAAF